jgi:hypothetical protein
LATEAGLIGSAPRRGGPVRGAQLEELEHLGLAGRQQVGPLDPQVVARSAIESDEREDRSAPRVSDRQTEWNRALSVYGELARIRWCAPLGPVKYPDLGDRRGGVVRSDRGSPLRPELRAHRRHDCLTASPGRQRRAQGSHVPQRRRNTRMRFGGRRRQGVRARRAWTLELIFNALRPTPEHVPPASNPRAPNPEAMTPASTSRSWRPSARDRLSRRSRIRR